MRKGGGEGRDPAGVVLRPVDVGHDSEALREAMASSWRVPRFNSTTAFAAWLRKRLEREWLEFAVVAPARNPAQVAGYAVAWDYRPVDGHAHVDVRVVGAPAGIGSGDVAKAAGPDMQDGPEAQASAQSCFVQAARPVGHGLLGMPARATVQGRSAMSLRPDVPGWESFYTQAAGAFVLRLFCEYPLRKLFIEKVAGAAPPWGDAATSAGQPATAGGLAKGEQAADGLLPLRHEMTLREYTFQCGAYRDLDVWSLSRGAWEEWVRG